MRHCLGVPYERHEFFQSRSMMLLSHRAPPEQRFDALRELFGFLDELVWAEEAKPGDNLLGRQVRRRGPGRGPGRPQPASSEGPAARDTAAAAPTAAAPPELRATSQR